MPKATLTPKTKQQKQIDQKHLIEPKITKADYLLNKLLVGDYSSINFI